MSISFPNEVLYPRQSLDYRFLSPKLWTSDEVKLGVRAHMNEVLEYIKHILQYQVRITQATLFGDVGMLNPDREFWKRHFQVWVPLVDRSLTHGLAVHLQGITVCQNHICVYLILQWAEYPQTINKLVVGIE